MEDRIVKQGQIYRHFKGKLYQIICIAHHSENDEKLVVYQALYGKFGICARPYDMFLSEVDRDKYPDVKVKYRFELVGEVSAYEVEEEKEEIVKEDSKKPLTNLEGTTTNKEEKSGKDINPLLLDFLNAKSYSAKREIFSKMKNADDKLLNDIAVSLDFALPEGDLTTKYEAIYKCINTHARFEVNRR